MSLDTRETLQSIAPSYLAAAALSGSPIVKALGMWLEYASKENHYRELSNDELKHMIWVALEGRTYIHRGKGGDEEKTLNLNTKISADVREALIHLALETGIEELPFWRDQRDDDPDPRYLLPVSNGLLDWKTGELIAPTPRFVSTDCSQVAYDRDAVTFMWDFFLDEIFDGDLEQIELLHEVMGCILTGQTGFQKIFQLFGPARSGKGTINLMLIKGRQAEILREASTVTAFASECLIEDPAATTSKLDIYDAYMRYCQGHGRSNYTDQNIFWRDLRASGKFRNDMERRIRADGRRVQAVEGLRVQLDEAALPFEPADDFLD